MKVSRTLLAVAVASTPLMASAVQLEDYLVANSSYEDAFVSGTLNAIEPAGDSDDEQIGYTTLSPPTIKRCSVHCRAPGAT